jgi:ABC-type thiamin/hydroxymethylpyrimidine transport system permease subunit
MAVQTKLFQRFTAVDLVTIAVFGALYRALWYVWNAFNFLFPFNQALNILFNVMCTIAVLVIVRKVGAATLFQIAAMLINVFIQGESLLVALIGCTNGIAADLICYVLLRLKSNVWNALGQMTIAGAVTAFVVSFNLWVTMFKLVYMIPMESAVFYAVFALSLVAGVLGGMAGFGVGDRIKGLIG